MFLEALEQLHRWKRKHLPAAETPQGAELLIWILKNQTGGAPLKDLYRRSRFSEPTVRARLNTFIAEGLVVVELDVNDSRRHMVRPTAKLERTIIEYIQRIEDTAKAPLENEPKRARALPR
jgi:DNA-binding MarR family transcriptional regulator